MPETLTRSTLRDLWDDLEHERASLLNTGRISVQCGPEFEQMLLDQFSHVTRSREQGVSHHVVVIGGMRIPVTVVPSIGDKVFIVSDDTLQEIQQRQIDANVQRLEDWGRGVMTEHLMNFRHQLSPMTYNNQTREYVRHPTVQDEFERVSRMLQVPDRADYPIREHTESKNTEAIEEELRRNPVPIGTGRSIAHLVTVKHWTCPAEFDKPGVEFIPPHIPALVKHIHDVEPHPDALHTFEYR